MPVVAVGRAERLSLCENESYSVVLALGPFYHLIEARARNAAIGELMRVLRPGGITFVAFIPRLSGLVGLVARGANDASQVTPEVVERVATEGVFVNPTSRGFQDGYYPEVEEIVDLFCGQGFQKMDLFSIRGGMFGVEGAFEAFREGSPGSASALANALKRRSRNPGVIEQGGHALLVLRKPSDENA